MNAKWETRKGGCMLSHSVVSDSLRLHGLESIRLLCPWNFPGENTGVGCHFLLQGIFPTQGLNRVSCSDRRILYHWGTWETCLLIVLAFYNCYNKLPKTWYLKTTNLHCLSNEIYSWPLNNTGLNCAGSLTCGFFHMETLENVLEYCMINSWLNPCVRRRADCKIIHGFFSFTGASAPNSLWLKSHL